MSSFEIQSSPTSLSTQGEAIDPELQATLGRPKTGMVLALLAIVALIFSYLTAYCLINALVAAEVMTRWPSGQDPRFKYFIGTFTGMMIAFGTVAFLARNMSRRQLSRIDAMEDEEESTLPKLIGPNSPEQRSESADEREASHPKP